jgi:fatty-acyl-CoA synthase
VFAADPHPSAPALADLRLAAAGAPDVEVDRDDVALICYTSGTTGLPKGALITHGNIYAGAVAKCLAVGQTHRDRLLIPMPLAYTGGCVALLRDGITPGATTYLEPDADPERFLDLIEKERITSLVSVATLFEMMMQHPRFDSADLSSLTHAVTGGTTVTPHLLQAWMDRGVEITQGYGLTEAGGAFVTLLFPSDAIRKWGFTGKKLMHLDVIIVDEKGNELPPGESGEVLVRGPVVMKGYLGKPDETAKTLEGGWLHTGDVGFLDDEGFLKIVDRVKDMLISGGLNVYPAEIERALGGASGLDEFCVIGVSDERWGEVPMIVASSLDGVDIAVVWERCCDLLADYKRPQYIVEHGPLPRTLSAKITKKPLREQYPKAPAEAIALKPSNGS